MLQDLPARLRRRFSQRRLHLSNDGPSPLAGGAGATTRFLVGRGLCVFLSIDCSRIPKRRREAFIVTAVKRAAPFADPEFHVVWLKESAAVWAWSRQRVRDIAGTWSANDRFEAESPYVDHPHDNAVRLVALRAGYEGRVWRDGALVASQWWPAPPEQEAFADFLRSAGGSHESDTDCVADDATFNETPWQSIQHGKSLARLKPYLPAIAMAAASIIACAFLWQIGRTARVASELISTQSTLKSRSTDFERILAARESAERSQQAIGGLLSLRPPAAQMQMLREAESLMTATGWRITRWSQVNPESLEVAFKLANPDSEAIVSRWENSNLFEDVVPTIDRDGQGLTMKMTVTSSRRPLP